jgi:hypothetical protein
MIQIERDRVANGTWFETKPLQVHTPKEHALLEIPLNPQTKTIEIMPYVGHST